MAIGMVNGQYAFDCGFKRQGSRSQEKFYLGKNEGQAEIRKAMVKEVLRVKGGSPIWVEPFLSIAKAVSKGEREVEVDTSPVSPAQQVQQLEDIQKDLPFIRLKLPAHVSDMGKAVWSQFAQQDLESLRPQLEELIATGTLGGLALGQTGFAAMVQAKGTLHQAFDDYIAKDIKTENIDPETRSLTAYGVKREERVKRFKRDIKDCQLTELDFVKCDEIIKFYKARPNGKRTGKPISVKDAQHCIKELKRFFRWLRLQRYNWRMPEGLEEKTYKVAKMDSERRLKAYVKVTYTIDQLATIARHCTPMDRMILFTALNTAGGARELGGLWVEEVLLNQPHPEAELIGMSENPANFIQRNRDKSVVYGEWTLWEETAQALKWGIARAEELGSPFVFCAETGSPLYNRQSKNPQQNFANTWNDIIKRVRKSHPDFPYLPFGSLRDTLPDLMRRKYGGELASMLVAHGNPLKQDELLELYSNKPWAMFHKAIAELREVMLPVLTAPSAYTNQSKRYNAIDRTAQEVAV